MTLFTFLVLAIVLYIYHPWFTFSGTLSSGDWPYLFVENIREFSFLPQSQFLWLAPYYQIPTKIFVEYLHIPWEVVERLLWFWPFIVISILSSYYLTKSWVGVLIYTTNTYILMVVGGGQMGIAMAYAVAPFVLGKFMKLIENSVFRIQNSLLAGLLLAALVMFDPRIGYATMLAVLLYFLFHFRLKAILEVFLIPVVLTMALNVYWIIPIVRNGFPAQSAGFANLEGFRFLSFTDFSNAIGLRHPNWPENIFGKVSFMKPEFLVLPILAFASMLFAKRNDKRVLFFALLGLIGAFLAKGTREPFGMVNELLFQYVPGMSMFRDATKFYLLIALSYTVLIPYTLSKSPTLGRINAKHLIYGLFLIFFLFTIRQAVGGELGGTFKAHEIPHDYILLKDYLLRQPESFNTFWIPLRQRFGFMSKNHPAINAQAYFETTSVKETLDNFTKNDKSQFLREASVHLVIVPYDSEEELFLAERMYDENLHSQTIQTLEKIPWLLRRPGFGKIAVFEVQ